MSHNELLLPFNYPRFLSLFHSFLDSAGVPPGTWSLHSLRRGGATHLFSSTSNFDRVAHIGRASTSTIPWPPLRLFTKRHPTPGVCTCLLLAFVASCFRCSPPLVFKAFPLLSFLLAPLRWVCRCLGDCPLVSAARCALPCCVSPCLTQWCPAEPGIGPCIDSRARHHWCHVPSCALFLVPFPPLLRCCTSLTRSGDGREGLPGGRAGVPNNWVGGSHALTSAVHPSRPFSLPVGLSLVAFLPSLRLFPACSSALPSLFGALRLLWRARIRPYGVGIFRWLDSLFSASCPHHALRGGLSWSRTNLPGSISFQSHHLLVIIDESACDALEGRGVGSVVPLR